MQLEDQLRRYAEEVADPAAVGPDPMEVLGDVGERPSRAGRLALVACLVVLVVVTGGVLVARSRADAPAPAADHSVTATVAGDQLAVSLTVDDPDVAYGDTLIAHAVITNVSDAPLSVVNQPGFVFTLGWGSTATTTSGRSTTLDMVGRSYRQTSLGHPTGADAAAAPVDPLDDRAHVTLAPGESVRVEGTRVADQEVRTGPAVLSITPWVARSTDGKPVVGPLNDVTVSVPVTIGPSPSGVLTLPDGVAAILADPQLVAWGAAADAKGGIAGAFTGNLEQSGDGWRLLFGADDGSSGPDVESDLRQFGGPGFIARVAGDGTVTVEWIVSP